jgi:hypothetical protein
MSWLHQFREDNRLLAELLAGPFGKFYAVCAAATFFFQVGERLKICPDFLACSLSMVKNIVWSVAWPLWWAMYATRFQRVSRRAGAVSLE